MERLIKTRALVGKLAKKDRQSKVGRPIPDYTYQQVSKEIAVFERKLKSYKLTTFILSLVILISIFIANY